MIHIRDNLGLAADALRAHKLRAALTVLGLTMGVATLITVMTIVQGANIYVEQKIANLGTNVFRVGRLPFAVTDFALMTRPVRLTSGKPDDYGFGWWIDPLYGHVDVYHDGDTFGMSSSNNLFLREGVDVIVLANQADDSAAAIAHAVARVVL